MAKNINKETKLDEALLGIEKFTHYLYDEPIPTGIIPLDIVLNGGLPAGITQLVGESGTGKTNISLQISKKYCDNDKKVLYVDTKGDIDFNRLEKMGLNDYINKRFIYIREGTFNEVEKELDKLIATGELSLIVIDSIASLIHSGYLNLNDRGIKSDNCNSGYNSKPLSNLVKKLGMLAIKYHLTIILTNQFRNTFKTFGNGAGTIKKIYGPKALSYESRYIIQIDSINERINHCKDFKKIYAGVEASGIGKSLVFQVTKGPNSFKPLPFFLDYKRGCLPIYLAIYTMINTGKVIQNGSYFKLKGTDINTKGMLNFVKEVSKYLSSVDLSASSSLRNYYNSLISNEDII